MKINVLNIYLKKITMEIGLLFIWGNSKWESARYMFDASHNGNLVDTYLMQTTIVHNENLLDIYLRVQRTVGMPGTLSKAESHLTWPPDLSKNCVAFWSWYPSSCCCLPSWQISEYDVWMIPQDYIRSCWYVSQSINGILEDNFFLHLSIPP